MTCHPSAWVGSSILSTCHLDPGSTMPPDMRRITARNASNCKLGHAHCGPQPTWAKHGPSLEGWATLLGTTTALRTLPVFGATTALLTSPVCFFSTRLAPCSPRQSYQIHQPKGRRCHVAISILLYATSPQERHPHPGTVLKMSTSQVMTHAAPSPTHTVPHVSLVP